MDTTNGSESKTFKREALMLAFINGNGYVFGIEDYRRMRKEHRIIGFKKGHMQHTHDFEGSARFMLIELSRLETQLLVDEGLAVLVSKKKSLPQDATAEDPAEHLMQHWAQIVKLPPESSLKYRVFRDFWQRGKCVVGGEIFGVDLMVYPGDPNFCKSSHFIILLPDAEVMSSYIYAKARLAMYGQNKCVLAYFAARDDDTNYDEPRAIHYQTIFLQSDNDKVKEGSVDEVLGNSQDNQTGNEASVAKEKCTKSVKEEQPSTSRHSTEYGKSTGYPGQYESVPTGVSQPNLATSKEEYKKNSKDYEQANPSGFETFVGNLANYLDKLAKLKDFQVSKGFGEKKKLYRVQEYEQLFGKEIQTKMSSTLKERVPNSFNKLLRQIETGLKQTKQQAQRSLQKRDLYNWKNLKSNVVEKMYQNKTLALKQLYQQHERADESPEPMPPSSWKELAELIANTWNLNPTPEKPFMSWNNLGGAASQCA